ncbi:MAG: dihydrodipicolinate synthase family protein [Pirellulales bacterium]
MLTRETFTGPWAGLPVAWTDEDRFDEATYRADIRRCCEAGVPGVYSGGTTGEFYAMEFDEFQTVALATAEECRNANKPAMIGCSSTYTLGVIRRARFAAEIGADAIQVALPFWMEIGETEIVPFFKEVSDACGGMPLSIYETTRAKRTLTLDQHREIHDVVPSYLMVKSNAGTVGVTEEGCQSLSEIVNVFVGESLWESLGPKGARGCCSSMVYWNPKLVLNLWDAVERENWQSVQKWNEKIAPLFDFLHQEFGAKGFTDSAFDRLGGVAGGFLKTSLRSRGPYPCAAEEDVETLRRWYEDNFAEMLQLE